MLRNAEMLNDLPRRMRHVGRPPASSIGCEILDGLIEVRVRVAAAERSFDPGRDTSQ